MILSDQSDRDRFAGETGRNFSVIAPAGVGKTTAIAARVLQLARDDERRRLAGQAPLLPGLVVVTYTRKAADEMRDRARRALVEDGVAPHVLGRFNEAFFGTIHSFCFELLRRFGPLAGLPTRFTVELDDTALRLAWQRDTPDVAAFLPEAARAPWRRYGAAEAIWALVWSWPPLASAPPPPGPCPQLNLPPLFAFQPKRKHQKTLDNIRRALDRLRRWQEASAADERALDLPEAKLGGEEFTELWAATFQPLREWLAAAAAHAAAGLAEAYVRFKESSGRLGYDDFVRLAARLLRDPVLAERIREANFSVLLDEAQDTDPGQFAVLIGVAQPPGAPGLWAEGAGAPPEPGRFSMVGDPQQSIYERANVAVYQQLHHRLISSGAAEALTFSVTMRCDTGIVASVNSVFPGLLHGRDGQARFVPLQSRPQAGAGGVWRLPIARPDYFPAKATVAQRTQAEAAALARVLAAGGPGCVGAGDWSQVAILCPRKGPDWLGAMAVALRAVGLKAQVHSTGRGHGAAGGDPARTWLGALLGILTDPEDVFEVAGVLREIFGISDDELFYWRHPGGDMSAPGTGHSLSLQRPPPEGVSGRVAAALGLLHGLVRAVAAKPLRDAVAQVVAETQLGARLAVLPDQPAAGAWVISLAALLDQAALADARGETLADFARALKLGPTEAAEPVARPGELQLFTGHKAKGLEWDVVILFGLFRKPGFASEEYPRWLASSAPGQPPRCLYDSTHAANPVAAGGWKQEQNDLRRAAFERLLYVCATRPRRALIAVDAEALGADEESLAAVLGLLEKGPARPWWKALPVPGPDGPPREDIISNIVNKDPEEEPAWPAGRTLPPDLKTVRTHAEAFARRVRPSSLANHAAPARPERDEPDLFAPPDYPEDQLPPSAAVTYGNWWHTLMEKTPWTAGANAWAAHWEKQFDSAPDPVRARAEAVRLLASPLAKRLAKPGLEFAPELPFLWPEPGGKRAFDGCIDLAVWDATTGAWLIIDWKTDRIEGDATTWLRTRYGAQLEVYARALGAVFDAPVEAFLYGTRSGALARVQASG